MKDDLKKKAKWVRRQVLETVVKSGRGGHIGGIFSCVDLLVALYYGNILKFDPKNFCWSDRDRLIIGKGHASLALYHILVDLGFFDVSLIEEYGKDGSRLGVQLNINTPGIEYSTGSLGHAIGIGAGLSLAAKMDKKNYRTFALVGDGECSEGSIWESMMFAGQKKLNNLIGIIDYNKLSVTDFIEVEEENKFKERIESCNWDCLSINGHNFEDIVAAFQGLEKLERPLMIIADTIKGKGVSFMENNIKWHNSALTEEELELARKEL